ncbi:hypothetical protein PYL56_07845 [Staphylococcus succinus]|uniref:hypothetical protein n=1 Tax=Staphylococcus succinus TaxID=61015 RepID=UPI00247FD978|nr:hypothetical protein [Staphylococcus succinus]MDH9161278.1 hypothetical protein [Staphylococcus succinus]
MKIKTKKQLNLPQLIEWAWDNPELSQYKMFEKIGATMRDYVSFNNEENGVRLNGTVKPTDLFTVEVEEEITEDTVIPKLVEIYKDFLGGTEILKHEYKSINKVKDEEALYFYILNDDLTITLIWRDGKLVE